MVVCCVPRCGSKSWKCDPSVSFHEFPSNPDMAAKWIKNINLLISNGGMWYPQDNPVICSQHFLPVDFKLETKEPTLKPRSVPTRFEKYPGFGYTDVTSDKKRKNEESKAPVIVKVIKLSDDENEINEDPTDFISSPNKIDVLLNQIEVCKNTTGNDTAEPQLRITNVSSLSDVEFKASKYGSANKTVKGTKRQFEYVDTDGSPQNGSFTPVESTDLISSPEAVNVASGSASHKVASFEKKTSFQNQTFVQKKAAVESNKKVLPKTKNAVCRTKQSGTDLIEIGPSTFLKINPDVIKVAKKITPSGNTVLQFVMDQNVILSKKDNSTPTRMNHVSARSNNQGRNSNVTFQQKKLISSGLSNNSPGKYKSMVQQVVGHLVDNQASNDTCTSSKEFDDQLMNENSSVLPDTTSANENYLAESECIANAPVLLTTNLPVNRCFMSDKQRYTAQLKQKSRLISSLKAKTTNLSKKIEELENRCIVQERQLSYTSLKKLKTIKKNAEKGEHHANYILEQIRGYSGGNKMRWSDSTLRQCSIWCRKAPYAYEYFKKADLFKLPCLGTVKRYIKRHPELKGQTNNIGVSERTVDDDSSSDFDFDDSDGSVKDDDSTTNIAGNDSVLAVSKANNQNISLKEQILSKLHSTQTALLQKQFLSKSGEIAIKKLQNSTTETNIAVANVTENLEDTAFQHISENTDQYKGESSIDMPVDETDSSPISNNKDENSQILQDELVHNSPPTEEQDEAETALANLDGQTIDENVQVQEIILQSGDIVQCLNSQFGGSQEFESQYYIIPSINDQNVFVDHQYSVVQQQTVPMIIENAESEQEQIIYITGSSDLQESASVEFSDH